MQTSSMLAMLAMLLVMLERKMLMPRTLTLPLALQLPPCPVRPPHRPSQSALCCLAGALRSQSSSRLWPALRTWFLQSSPVCSRAS